MNALFNAYIYAILFDSNILIVTDDDQTKSMNFESQIFEF